MDYELGKAPILRNGRMCNVRVNGTVMHARVIGRSTIDSSVMPMYIVECLDGTLPSDDYPYVACTVPLKLIED